MREMSSNLNFHQVQTYLQILTEKLDLNDEGNLFMTSFNPLKQAVLIM